MVLLERISQISEFFNETAAELNQREADIIKYVQAASKGVESPKNLRYFFISQVNSP